MQKLLEEKQIERDNLRILFIGKNAHQYIPNTPPFEVHDYMPHKELEHFRAQAHLLLLILGTTPDNVGNLSGKIYEYLATNRPILAIVPPGGAAQQLIQETKTGITVDGDVSSIASAILKLYRRWQMGSSDWQPNWPIIRQYTRRALTQRLAAEFDLLAAAKEAA